MKVTLGINGGSNYFLLNFFQFMSFIHMCYFNDFIPYFEPSLSCAFLLMSLLMKSADYLLQFRGIYDYVIFTY